MLTTLNQGSDLGSIYYTGFTNDKEGWLKNVIGTSAFGFIGSDYTGTENQKFCDYGSLHLDENFCFGGAWDYNNKCGPFTLWAFPMQNLNYCSARLIYI